MKTKLIIAASVLGIATQAVSALDATQTSLEYDVCRDIDYLAWDGADRSLQWPDYPDWFGEKYGSCKMNVINDARVEFDFRYIYESYYSGTITNIETKVDGTQICLFGADNLNDWECHIKSLDISGHKSQNRDPYYSHEMFQGFDVNKANSITTKIINNIL